MAEVGTNFLLAVNTGTPEAPVFTVIGEQKGLEFDTSTGEIDVSHKGIRDQKLLAGRNSATMSVDANNVPTDVGQQALIAAQEAHELILVTRLDDGVPVQKAYFLVTSISYSDPDEDVSTFSASLARSGSWLSAAS